MAGRTATDDDVIRKQQERDLGHSQMPQDSLPDETATRDGEVDKDKRPGVAGAEQLGDLPRSRNAGATPEDAVDPVPDTTGDPRLNGGI